MLSLRRSISAVFLFAGALKLFKLPAFAAVLGRCGVPVPGLFGVSVPLLELLGGACLWRGRATRPAAAPLAVDMVFALALIGLPGKRLRAGAVTVGGEAWRAPLETALLLGLLYLAWRGRDAAD